MPADPIGLQGFFCADVMDARIQLHAPRLRHTIFENTFHHHFQESIAIWQKPATQCICEELDHREWPNSHNHHHCQRQGATKVHEMGLVDFAIDLAAVLNASRSVASKHIALRGRQLDRYGQTSSVVTVLRQKQAHRTPGDASPATATAAAAATTTTTTVPEDAGTKAAEQQSPTHDLDTVSSTESSSKAIHDASLEPEGPVKTDNDPVPDDVILDQLFRTNRGSRLNPLWKGDQRGRSEDPPSGRPGYAAFRAGRRSNVIDELRKTDTEQANLTKLASSITQQDIWGSAAPTIKWRSSSAPEETTHSGSEDAGNPASAFESQRETEEIEVPRYPKPTTTKSENIQPDEPVTTAEKPVTTADASQLGEMLGAAAVTPKHELRESRVPSSRLGRIWNYSGLAAGMLGGAISESFSRIAGGAGEGSLILSPANMERLVAKLSKMRGAALKIGQMLSFQDSKMLPAPIQEVLQRVQDRADYMPAWQRDRVLATNLGAEWRELFDEFEEKPIAAASIGQVHRATLKSTGAKVAVKIQFPGVADSINSDLDNLSILLTATKLLPKGLYLNKTIDNARTELGWECDYEREATCAQRYRELLAAEDDVFLVPKIYPEASGKQVLTMEFMDGVGVTRIQSFTQEQRDWIGTQILRLCLREITEFHFMQTDPNWTNFLYNAERDRLVLLDFGASREYPERFITLYVRLLAAASRADREAVKTLSEELGYLTGHESKTMLDAHIASILTLAEPFLESAPEVYDFRDQTITERVKAQIPVMIRERLAPPPEETYSLHRKLSGAFLLCARLGSRVRCREMFEKSVVKSGVLERDV